MDVEVGNLPHLGQTAWLGRNQSGQQGLKYLESISADNGELYCKCQITENHGSGLDGLVTSPINILQI
jgi:hypothetical protein